MGALVYLQIQRNLYSQKLTQGKMTMSQAVDAIFAHNILAQYLQKRNIPYLPYEDFYDVIRQFPAQM